MTDLELSAVCRGWTCYVHPARVVSISGDNLSAHTIAGFQQHLMLVEFAGHVWMAVLLVAYEFDHETFSLQK